MKIEKLFKEFVAKVENDREELHRWAYLMLTGCFENQFRDHFAWFLQTRTTKSRWAGRDSHVKDMRLLKNKDKGDIVLYCAEKPDAIIELKAAYDFNVPTEHLDGILTFSKTNKYSLSKDLARWKKLGINLFAILLIAHIPPDPKLPVICKYVGRKAKDLKTKIDIKKQIQKKLKQYGWQVLEAFHIDLSREMREIVSGYSSPCSLSGYLLQHPDLKLRNKKLR